MKKFFERILKGIEVFGNALPHPFFLFVFLWIAVLIATAIFSGVSVVDPENGKDVKVLNLINIDGFYWVMSSLVKNYASFAALGLVLVMMLSLGVVTGTGLLENVIKLITKVPEKYEIFFIFLIGISGNIASSAASVIIPPLTAMLFYEKKRNPIFGLAVGFAAVSSGYGANLFITGTDVLEAGISTQAYKIVDPNGEVSPAANYFFMASSVIVLAICATYLTNKFLMPIYGKWDKKFEESEMAEDIKQLRAKDPDQSKISKGLKMVGFFTILYWIGIGLLSYFDVYSSKKILNMLVGILAFYFVSIGSIYGIVTGAIKKKEDIIPLFKRGASEATMLIVLIFPIANFIAAFEHSNLSLVVAVKIASFLSDHHIEGLDFLIAVMVLSAFMNLFMTSASEKWALMAPVIIPIGFYLGYNPGTMQLLFRLGDSATNTITPMYSYLALHLMTIQRYDKNAGLGDIFSKTAPYAFMFFTIWLIMFLIWYYFDLPMGPDSYIHLPVQAK